MQASAKVKIVE